MFDGCCLLLAGYGMLLSFKIKFSSIKFIRRNDSNKTNSSASKKILLVRGFSEKI